MNSKQVFIRTNSSNTAREKGEKIKKSRNQQIKEEQN